MMIKPRLALVATVAFALSGCGTIHSIFGMHSARMPEVRVPEAAHSEPVIAQAAEEGRSHLDKGETGLAIEAFQRALGMGAPTASALNGLGVAYARLGRYELAHRYFEQAEALDPTDGRYAANLARINLSPAFAMRHDADIAATVLKQESDKKEKAAVPALASDDPQPGRLTRVSSHEYKIQTVTPMAAPAVRSASSASQFKPLIRIEFGKPAQSKDSASDKAAAGNPPLGQAVPLDPRFKPIVRFNL